MNLIRLTIIVLLVSLRLAGSADAQSDDPFRVNLSNVVNPEGKREVIVKLIIPEAHYLYAESLAVTVDKGELEIVDVPSPIPKEDPFTGDMVDVYAHDTTLRYRLDAPGDAVITVNYMGCNQSLCFMPQSVDFPLDPSGSDAALPPSQATSLTENEDESGEFAGFKMIGREAGYLAEDEFLAFLARVEAGNGMQQGKLEALVANHGIWIGLLAILLGGFLLNLTPCVLPMIPVNLAIIGAGAAAGSNIRGFARGAVYGAGIAFVYGVLGVIVVLTGGQFGQLNASIGFNLIIAILFVALALAMLGVFNLDFTHFQSNSLTSNARGPLVTAFLFGGVAALLAGACVAPVVISVVVLATEFYQRGSQEALLLPFVLGLGMALPWPFAGAGMALLPKPGRWMERVKMGFGVVILLAAVYYGWLAFDLWQTAALADDAVKPTSLEFWETSPETALATAKDTGQPLFIDFWATWCKNCKAMDATTFTAPEVRKALGRYVRLKYQAEDLNDPATRRVLDALGIRGLPTYVVMEVNE